MKTNPLTGRPYASGYFTVDRVTNLLLLVDAPENLDVKSWTPEQLHQAGDWALRCHVRASDNNNQVPPRPDFIPEMTSAESVGRIADTFAALKEGR
jgi:hypothetical protein